MSIPEQHQLSRFAAGRWRARYGELNHAGLAATLRGWREWREEQTARHPDHAEAVAGIYAAATRWLREETARRLAPKPMGKHMTTAQLQARHGDRLTPTGPDRWRAVCPWHADNRPSLVVYADGHAHCFSCGEHRPVADLARAWEATVAA